MSVYLCGPIFWSPLGIYYSFAYPSDGLHFSLEHSIYASAFNQLLLQLDPQFKYILNFSN